MSLKAQLDACCREVETNVAPDVVAAVRRSIQALAETGLIAKAVKAGETAPLFRGRCRRGVFIELSELLARGPVVISFFWGDWCPYCILELKALSAAHLEIQQLGASLVALSPQAPDLPSSRPRGGEPPFPILRDQGCEVAARYRVSFTLRQQFRAAYRALGHPGPAKTGSKAWLLPVPATYILDSTGLVVLSYLDANHTTRLDPAEIIAALTHLRHARIPKGNNA